MKKTSKHPPFSSSLESLKATIFLSIDNQLFRFQRSSRKASENSFLKCTPKCVLDTIFCFQHFQKSKVNSRSLTKCSISIPLIMHLKLIKPKATKLYFKPIK